MKKSPYFRLAATGVLAALVCVATMVIQIPSPPTNGYVNAGDCLVLLSAWLLGPLGGFLAGGIGSGLADLLSGYAHYIPGTVIIKGLSALIFALIFRALKKIGIKSLPAWIVGGLAGEAIMVGGYFCYSALILGKGIGAAASVPGNIIQGALGIVISTLLMLLLSRTKDFQKFFGLEE